MKKQFDLLRMVDFFLAEEDWFEYVGHILTSFPVLIRYQGYETKKMNKTYLAESNQPDVMNHDDFFSFFTTDEVELDRLVIIQSMLEKMQKKFKDYTRKIVNINNLRILFTGFDFIILNKDMIPIGVFYIKLSNEEPTLAILGDLSDADMYSLEDVVQKLRTDGKLASQLLSEHNN